MVNVDAYSMSSESGHDMDGRHHGGTVYNAERDCELHEHSVVASRIEGYELSSSA